MATAPKQKYTHCSVCKREITNLHIRCAECAEPAVDLCGECFGKGSTSADVPNHKANHAYRVVDHLPAITLFDKDWNAKEELLLLDGIDMYGLGNWRDVANFIGSKTEQQCYKHYMAVYLDSKTAPLPSGDPTLPLGASYQSRGASLLEAEAQAANGGPQPGVGRTGASTSSAQGTPGYSHAHVPKTDVAGYMPLRGDFDIEHDNDAEAILADMDFVEGEHATETELKLKILEIYNSKLDERERRKSFVIERGLLEYKRLLAVERRRPKEEREVYDAFRPFARFMTPTEHEDLVRGVILENRLRKRISQLQEYRRAGIRSLAEAQEYEAAKRKREQSGSMRRQSSIVDTSATVQEGGARASRYASRRVGGEETAAAVPETGRKRRRDDGVAAADVVAAPTVESNEPPFSLEGIPGADRLSANERKLCEYLRLLPSQYFQIKATIINISLARGHVRREEVGGSLVHVDISKINGVYDFCITAGWANPSLDADASRDVDMVS